MRERFSPTRRAPRETHSIPGITRRGDHGGDRERVGGYTTCTHSHAHTKTTESRVLQQHVDLFDNVLEGRTHRRVGVLAG